MEIRFVLRRVCSAVARQVVLVFVGAEQGNECEEPVESCVRLQYAGTVTRLQDG
jgi:hypothetical protein